jgi:hypothetical protein
MTRTQVLLAASVLLAAGVVAANDTPPAGDEQAAADGFIYGTVETKAGKTHTGVLRWDDEEAFWDDLFHSSKRDLPYEKYQEPPEVDDDEAWWKRMVHTIGGEMGVHRQGRVLAVRFGDLAQIRVTGGDGAVLVLRDGTEIEVEGYANDVNATISVDDDKPGRVEVPWRKIDTITFQATPPHVDPGVFRLRGTVSTEVGDFVGFVQWDSQECLSSDRLDGDTDDEDKRVSLEMGEIRSIDRLDRRTAKVTLKDGTVLELSGTNDVNDDIRGILVEDERFGRIEVQWDEFRRVVFDDPAGSGRGRNDYPAPVHLRGTVTLHNGDWRKGDMVFDLDEKWSWEMLNGEAEEIEYTIPFAMVASIEPRGVEGSLVRLRNGEELLLADSHDVDDDNSGVVVLPSRGGEPAHVPWSEIANITFD